MLILINHFSWCSNRFMIERARHNDVRQGRSSVELIPNSRSLNDVHKGRIFSDFGKDTGIINDLKVTIKGMFRHELFVGLRVLGIL